jgi:hypothetical protein
MRFSDVFLALRIQTWDTMNIHGKVMILEESSPGPWRISRWLKGLRDICLIRASCFGWLLRIQVHLYLTCLYIHLFKYSNLSITIP